MLVILTLLTVIRYLIRWRPRVAALMGSTAALLIAGWGWLHVTGQATTAAEPSPADRFATGARAIEDHSGIHISANTSPLARRTLLREGTKIPPTPGRFLRSGSRWAFLPDAAPRTSVEGSALVQDPLTLQHDASLTHYGLMRATSPRTEDRGAGDRGAVERSDEPRSGRGISSVLTESPDKRSEAASGHYQSQTFGSDAEASVPSADDPAAAKDARQIVVIENLMLDRVITAIQADPADDRWTISGEVTEFNGENRLLLRTVQRIQSR